MHITGQADIDIYMCGMDSEHSNGFSLQASAHCIELLLAGLTSEFMKKGGQVASRSADALGAGLLSQSLNLLCALN